MIVTKLERQKNRRGRWSVFIDGEFVFSLDEVDLLYYKLREGEEISPNRLVYLRDEIVYAKACQKALDFLSHRPRTVKEIEKKLSEEYARDIISRVMDMLNEYKYIDDASYALEYAKERIKAGYGVLKVEWELKIRGIDQELIDAARELVQDIQFPSAVTVLKTRYRKKQIIDEKEKGRAYNYLLRRGFEPETAEAALQAFMEI